MLARSSRRYLLGHPWLTALSILGVALGVAVSVAVDLANASALRAFALSGEAVTGRATHQVVGGPGGVPDTLVAPLALAAEAAPVVEGNVRAAADSSLVLGVLGVDPLAEAAFRPFLGGPGDGGIDPALFLTIPGATVLSAQTAGDLGVETGDTLGLRVDGRRVAAPVVGVLTPDDDRSASALQNLLLVDVATAQEWFRTPGRLTRIDLRLPDDATTALARIEPMLPAGVGVRPSSSQAGTLETMTAAFRLNLQALSLLALVVGVFLIYNTVTFAVVQRRQTLGTFRALGVTRGETFRLVLGEALVVGVVGTALGVALGVLLGSGLVRLVTQTVTDLYFVVRVRELDVSAWSLAKGAALGLGATLLGALRPGWEAASTAPASALRRSSQEDALASGAGRLALAGLAGMALGALVLRIPGGVALAYVGLLLVLLGGALTVPWLTRLYARAVRPLAGWLLGPVGRMAARGITTSLSRTAVAVAALSVAVASTVGVSTMVTSFRATVVEWLGSVLQADVYVSPPATVFRRGGAILDSSLVADLSALPGVADVDAVRVRTLDTEWGPIDLVAVRLDERRADLYRYIQGSRADALGAVQAGVLVSEPFASRTGLGAGDRVTIPTDGGPRTLPIAAVYTDYGNDLGVVQMDEVLFRRLYRDPGPSGLALTAAPGVAPADLVAAARTRAEGRQQVAVRSNRELREASLEVFDRTFVVTSVLRLLAVGVAFVGVLSALMALQLERRRELAMLRAQGLTPGELRATVLTQTVLMGLWAGLLAVPLGLALAAVLVFVVNVRSFGWTLAFVVSPSVLVGAVGLAVVAAVLAGLYPAWAMGRADPALALRDA